MKLLYYQYEAYDSNGKLSSGNINALNEQEVVALLKARKLIPVKIISLKDSAQTSQKTSRISNEELINFTDGLNTLIAAQVPIDKALMLLEGLSDSRQTQYLIESMRRYVKEGGTLAQAMEDQQQVFSKMYISMIRAGEEGGILAELLPSLKQFLNEAADTKNQLINAMIYPVVLLFVGILSIILMIVFVVPQFASLFADSGVAVPTSAAFLFAISDWLKYYSWTLLLLAFALFLLLQWWLKDPHHQQQKDNFLLALPIMGELLLYRDAASFCRTIGALLEAGIPLLKSLSITRGVIENSALTAQLFNVEADVKSGLSLGYALEKNTDFPILMSKLVVVGEETGRTAQVFNQLADSFSQSVKNKLAGLLTLVEPILILLLGIMVGGIVVVMLLAVFSMNDIGL